jgi:peptidoglycan lytic transglycosylase G
VRRHLFPFGLWIVVAIVFAGTVGLGWVLYSLRAPYKGYATPSVLVRIPPGTSTMSILTALEQGGVVRDRRLGLVVLKLLHRGRSLKAGEYRFEGPRSVEQVILKIQAGDVVTYRFTVPEGLSAAEVFALFASQGFGVASEYAALFHQPATFDGVPKGAPTLEGALFPETYNVTRSMPAREIVSIMVHQFRKRLPPGFERKAAALGMSELEAVTLASLVEKETRIEEERPLVAAVFRNRLSKGMLLQCDPTTIYALKRIGAWKGTLTRSELAVAEPYNTYVSPGLPPGPICNPGVSSLAAAIAPAPVSYLYFVAAGDGTHRFATRYEDQQKNVADYLKARREAAKEGS